MTSPVFEPSVLNNYVFIAETKLCREKEPDLPTNWLVYLVSCLPISPDGSPPVTTTHVRLVGELARPLKRGRNKGQPKWGEYPMTRREFIIDIAEYRSMKRLQIDHKQ